MTPAEITLYGPPLFGRSKTTNTHRRCNICKQWKEYSEFFKDKNRDPAITHYCRVCDSEKNKERRRKKYEKIENLYGSLISGSQGKVTGTHRLCSICKQWKKHTHFGVNQNNLLGLNNQCRECVNAKDRKKRYGISSNTYKQLFDEQNGLCAICGVAERGNKYPYLCVDHGHATGKIRGLICNHCNTMLGYSKDNSDTLRKGAVYLERTCK